MDSEESPLRLAEGNPIVLSAKSMKASPAAGCRQRLELGIHLEWRAALSAWTVSIPLIMRYRTWAGKPSIGISRRSMTSIVFGSNLNPTFWLRWAFFVAIMRH